MACFASGTPVVAQGLGSTSAPAFTTSELLQFGQQTDAHGIRVGSFMVFPSASMGLGYDNNVFASSKDTRGSLTYKADATVNAVSNWSRHALQMYVNGSGNFQDDFSSENSGALRTGASGQLDVYRDLYVRAFVDFAMAPEDRGTGESFADFNRMINTTTVKYGGYVHKGFNRGWTELGASASHQDYDDASLSAAGGQPAVVVDQGFRDGSRSEVFGRVGYELSSLTSVFVETSYNEHDYTGTLFDSDGYKVMGGLRYQFSALTQGDFAVGYMHQNLGAYTTQSALDTYTYRGTLSYALTPLITLRLIAARDFGGPSHFAGASTRVNSDVGITADYAIRRDLTLSAGYGYNLTDYIGTGRTDNRHKLSLGAQYYLNRYASLFAKYDHTHFDAGRVLPDEVSTDYAKNVVLAGIRLRY